MEKVVGTAIHNDVAVVLHLGDPVYKSDVWASTALAQSIMGRLLGDIGFDFLRRRNVNITARETAPFELSVPRP